METLKWFMDLLPAWGLFGVGLTLWILSCVIALNLLFGKDSLFIYKQLQYAVGEYPAAVIFHILWFLWPLGISIYYITMMVILLEEQHWLDIWQAIRKKVIWLANMVIGLTALLFIYCSIT